jgi:hypothetical protein
LRTAKGAIIARLFPGSCDAVYQINSFLITSPQLAGCRWLVLLLCQPGSNHGGAMFMQR